MGQPKDKKRNIARILYLDRIPQKQIAADLEVTEATISRWAREGNWNSLRSNLLMSKQYRLAELYAELEEMNRMIKDKADYKVADNKQALVRDKLIDNIHKLENEVPVGVISSIAIEFCEFAKQLDMPFAEKALTMFTAFMEAKQDEKKWQL